jgi:beta-galactosidase
MEYVLNGDLRHVSWFGRGPHESYADRKSGAPIDLYSGDVMNQFHRYVRPQETGNKTDVRWLAVYDNTNTGILVAGDGLLNYSTWPFKSEQLEWTQAKKANRHGNDIREENLVTLNIDYAQMGVGGDNSWGLPVHEKYQILPQPYSWTYVLMPFQDAPERLFDHYKSLKSIVNDL